MKTKLFLLITGICSACTYAQIEFQEHIITYADIAKKVYSADLNGDGDMDVLFTGEDKVAWYENIGGGNFGPQQIIVDYSPSSLDLADVDLDGDMDILVVDYWFENIDGLGDFSSQHYVGSGGSRSSFTDLDGDGDMDVLTAVYEAINEWEGVYRIIWYPNVGGGNFPNYQGIAYFEWFFLNTFTLLPVDINGDGDMDVVMSGGWYENLGGGAFGSWHDFEVSASPRYFEDLDEDGDIDLIGFNYNNQIDDWYRNDGQGNFSFVSTIGNG